MQREIELLEGSRTHKVFAVPGKHYFMFTDQEAERQANTAFIPRQLMVKAFGEEAVRAFEIGEKPPAGPTLTDLQAMVYEVNVANGWHEDKGEELMKGHPIAQIAGLCEIPLALANVIEDIRKPTGNSGTTVQLQKDLAQEAQYRLSRGTHECTLQFLRMVGENGAPVHGSKSQAIARVNLFGTENAELIEAILRDDVEQIEDELSDCLIRPLDFAGGWNEAHPDRPIDIQRGILKKLEKNKTRGHRHGGKLA